MSKVNYFAIKDSKGRTHYLPLRYESSISSMKPGEARDRTINTYEQIERNDGWQNPEKIIFRTTGRSMEDIKESGGRKYRRASNISGAAR